MIRFVKGLIVIILGALATIYLANPTAGIVELIPDNWPLVGNLDEAGMAVLLLNCLRYFGIDLAGIFKRSDETGEKGSRRDIIEV